MRLVGRFFHSISLPMKSHALWWFDTTTAEICLAKCSDPVISHFIPTMGHTSLTTGTPYLRVNKNNQYWHCIVYNFIRIIVHLQHIGHLFRFP